MRTSNPILNEETFAGGSGGVIGYGETMTVEGTVNKTAFLVVLALLAASLTWNMVMGEQLATAMTWMWIGLIGGFIVALITIFRHQLAPFTAPVYAVLEGLFLGAISAVINQQYPGVAFQAVMLTFGTLLVMLGVYRSGMIKVTDKFKAGVVAATGAIFVVYLLSFLLRFAGVSVPFIHDATPIGIVISLVIVGIAALNLVLDFDFIVQGSQASAPKYMEWYGAFGLMVTLVWLYIEFLRLLRKLNSR